jgi:hypothetical protein
VGGCRAGCRRSVGPSRRFSPNLQISARATLRVWVHGRKMTRAASYLQLGDVAPPIAGIHLCKTPPPQLPRAKRRGSSSRRRCSFPIPDAGFNRSAAPYAHHCHTAQGTWSWLAELETQVACRPQCAKSGQGTLAGHVEGTRQRVSCEWSSRYGLGSGRGRHVCNDASHAVKQHTHIQSTATTLTAPRRR